MAKTKQKKYAGKTSKQYIAEQLFESGKEYTNEEIAEILSFDISPTTEGYVRVLRSRWQQRIQNIINKNPQLTKTINKALNKEDTKEVWHKAVYRIGSDMATGELNEDNRTKAFNTIIQKG